MAYQQEKFISLLTVLEAEKSKIKALADSVSEENPLHKVHIQLSSGCVFPGRRRERALWCLFYMDTNPTDEGFTLMAQSPPKTPPANTIILGLGFNK